MCSLADRPADPEADGSESLKPGGFRTLLKFCPLTIVKVVAMKGTEAIPCLGGAICETATQGTSIHCLVPLLR